MLVTQIWSLQPGKYFCLSSRPKDQKAGKLTNHWFEKYEFHRVAPKIKELRKHSHVWFCAHGFKQRKRREEVAAPTHFLYADLDNVNPRRCPVKPSIAVESSPGRFVGYWHVGHPIDWATNQAWTYQIGADKGGWDPTQVLRAPMSFNYKYDEAPRVTTLWTDLNKIPIDTFKIKAPTGVTVQGSANSYLKYEKKLPAMLRREINAREKTVRDRSEWIWKSVQVMKELGITTDEIFDILWPSGNNKWFQKKKGPEFLRRDIRKAFDKSFSRKAESKEDASEGMFSLSMAEVTEEKIDWLWEPYIARSEVTIIEGDPGVGKSWLAQLVGIHIADGKALPTVKPFKARALDPENVFFFDHENSRSTVMKIRLRHNGLKNEDRFFQEEASYSVDDEDAMERLYDAIRERKPAMIVWDTLMNYAGGANIHNAAETAQMFGTFRHIALEHNVASVVLRHLTKDNKTRSMYRGQGSITFTGTARCVIGVGYSEHDTDVRLFKITKTNITDPNLVGARELRFIPVQGQGVRVEFGDVVQVTNDQLYSAEQPKAEDSTELRERLEEAVSTKWMKESKLLAKFGAQHSEASIRKVLYAIGCKSRDTPVGRKWCLPRSR
jgi:AAA domain